MAFHKKRILDTLDDILKRGRISKKLREAVSETARAVRTGDFDLAYQISACKSLVVGELKKEKGRDDAFREDGEANERVLGGSVYGLLDGVHFNLSMKVGKLGSGTTVFCGGPQGISIQQMEHEGNHPVVRRIKLENRRIAREVREMTVDSRRSS